MTKPAKDDDARRTAAPKLSRRERALRTRQRMLRAAYDLFCEDGYTTTTMQGIARRAEVAVQTLYFTFGTKNGLLSEVVEAAVVGFDDWPGPIPPTLDVDALLEMLPWFAAVRDEPDAHLALGGFVRGAIGPLSRVAPLTAAMHAADGDPMVQATLQLGESRREASWRAVVRLLAGKANGLRNGLTESNAVDVMMVLLSSETLYHFSKRGWSDDAIRAWLTGMLQRELLGN